MILVGLLRHGKTEGDACYRGWQDDPLSSSGLAQMWRATQGPCPWNRVISSPLKRCAAFASEFARIHDLPLALDDRLKEIHFGEWEGRSAAQLMSETPTTLADFWRDPLGHPPPGGESLQSLQSRVVKAWQALCRQHEGERVLLVTHGGVIRILLCHLRQHPLERIMEIEVKHASLFGLLMAEGAVKTLFTSQAGVQKWLETRRCDLHFQA